jgi:hypothetical protein
MSILKFKLMLLSIFILIHNIYIYAHNVLKFSSLHSTTYIIIIIIFYKAQCWTIQIKRFYGIPRFTSLYTKGVI